MVTQQQAGELLQAGDSFSFKKLQAANDTALSTFPEVQVAVEAATASTTSAISMAQTMNRVRKIAQGKEVRGQFTAEAQDCLRSALQFSGAGLDTALKRLIAESLPLLVPKDQSVAKQFESYAQRRISDAAGGVNPKELVQILLNTGQMPRDALLQRWIYDLQSSSAQSAERVSELATACGVVDKTLRKRIKPTESKTSLLEKAFLARNQIAHELDVTKPEQAARQPLESIRRAVSYDGCIRRAR